MSKIIVLIPTFNEAQTLEKVLTSIPRLRGHDITIVISDDGSTDNTVAIARRFTNHVLAAKSNQGVGASTTIGFLYAVQEIRDGGYLIKFDGDGQHQPELIEKVLWRLDEGRFDLVVCSRFHQKSTQHDTPPDRIHLNHQLSEMVNRVTGWKLTDVRSGFVGLPIRHVKTMSQRLITKGYGVPMEIILRLWRYVADARVFEVPHPALYSSSISQKIGTKYRTETPAEKQRRKEIALQALYAVLDDLRVPRETATGRSIPIDDAPGVLERFG